MGGGRLTKEADTLDAANPFAQIPSTPEPIVAQVCRQLQTDPFVKSRLSSAELGRLASAAVRELWDCPVKTFVPILALRAVREQLSAMVASSAEPALPSAAARPGRGPRRVHDVLNLDDDVLPRDPTDRLLI